MAEKGPLGVKSSQLSETSNMCNYLHSNSDSLATQACHTDGYSSTPIVLYTQAGPIDNYQTLDGRSPGLSHRYYTDDHPLTPIIRHMGCHTDNYPPPTFTHIVCHTGCHTDDYHPNASHSTNLKTA